jgi:hypothetical protein
VCVVGWSGQGCRVFKNGEAGEKVGGIQVEIKSGYMERYVVKGLSIATFIKDQGERLA